MKSICFIAARGGSKGIPNKNTKIINGKPLIAYTIESAINSEMFNHIVVSTDSKKIQKIANRYGAEVPFLRPPKLAGDNVGIINVILHGIKTLKLLGYDFDVIVIRDCTVPFITSMHIKESLELINKEKCDGVFAVYKQHLNPYFNMMELNRKGFLRISKKPKNEIKSRQNSPLVYQLNGLFVFNVNSLVKYKKLFMPKMLPYEISQKAGFMIDTKFELEIAKYFLSKKLIDF